MTTIARLTAFLLASMLATADARAASGKLSLDAWMDESLIPAVVSQLNTHPRFNDEIVRFVVMQDGKPSATTNSLAIALRDRLQDAVVDQTDIRVGWQVDLQKFDRRSEQSRVDCTTSEVHYYVGLELREVKSGRFTVTVRALDVARQSWVAGFGDNWQGALSTLQNRAQRQPESDPAYLGQRTVPFTETQVDLLAAQLARDLGCSLLRQMSGEYVAALADDQDRSLNSTLALVSNNLASYQALQIRPDDVGTNSRIEAKAHKVDGDLYQYWVTITPSDPALEMPTISASAYIYLQETFLPASPAIYARSTDVSDISKNETLIRSLQIVSSDNRQLCDPVTPDSRRVYGGRTNDQPGQCFALQTETTQDSVIFFLYHQLNNGLVRLAGSDCSSRTNARIARKQKPLLFPLAFDAAAPPSWLPGNDWMIEPDADTFYAIASSDTKAARALGHHFEKLPKRCGRSVRPGFEGAELRKWFDELGAIAIQWDTAIDWQSVRVKNVF